MAPRVAGALGLREGLDGVVDAGGDEVGDLGGFEPLACIPLRFAGVAKGLCNGRSRKAIDDGEMLRGQRVAYRI